MVDFRFVDLGDEQLVAKYDPHSKHLFVREDVRLTPLQRKGILYDAERCTSVLVVFVYTEPLFRKSAEEMEEAAFGRKM